MYTTTDTRLRYSLDKPPPLSFAWMSPKSTRKLCNTVLFYRWKRTCPKSTRIALLVKRASEVRGRDSDSRTDLYGRGVAWCSRFFVGQSYLLDRNQSVGGRMHGSEQMKVSRFPRTVVVAPMRRLAKRRNRDGRDGRWQRWMDAVCLNEMMQGS